VRLPAYRTKTDLVYETLRKAILAGQYPAGSRIVLDQVAAELGTSKVPVREAVVRLVGEGWLDTRPHVGPTVPELSPQEIRETSVLRSVVEGGAVRYAVETITEDILGSLRTLLAEMDRQAADGDPLYPEANLRFHLLTFETCRYTTLKSMASDLVRKAARLRTVRFVPEYLAVSQTQHRQVVEALEARNAQLAETLVREHIAHAGTLLWHFAVSRANETPLSNR
jgi:DNA-binding GntR family transcriptional regulator